ncbi:MAG TPA: FAD-dependent oxidoreductase [Thermomicrobiales bacterium]|nr:FAD-dependent oxidoreductase [Thermomicrobiales bacterium]
MAQQENFDAIVIGAGQGGGPIASSFARDGRRTALIEREHAGGSYINWGCTPTKTMIASGRVAHVARRARGYGVHTGELRIDMERVRKRDVVQMFRDASRASIEGTDGLEYIKKGEARFTGEKTIEVALDNGGNRSMRAETFVLDVGQRARPLDLDIPAGVTILDNRSVMELDEVPEHLLVVGGGYVGIEFGQLFRRLGAEVTIVHRSDHLLSHEDPDVAEAVAEILREDGIALEMHTRPTGVTSRGEGIEVTIERSEDPPGTVFVSHVLAAAGRLPNTDSLDVEQTGLKLDDRGQIATDDRLETAVTGIYAIGDIRAGPKFTHISYDDYRILRANLIDGGNRSVDDRPVPYTTFIDPQLGRIGLTERHAQEQGIPYQVGRLQMSSVARAIETDETRGMMKALVHAETGRILGAAVLGIEGGRNRGDAPDHHDGQSALHRPARRCFRPPDARRVPQQRLRESAGPRVIADPGLRSCTRTTATWIRCSARETIAAVDAETTAAMVVTPLPASTAVDRRTSTRRALRPTQLPQRQQAP